MTQLSKHLVQLATGFIISYTITIKYFSEPLHSVADTSFGHSFVSAAAAAS
jgi:hypothetical protein